ncbi:SGNH/GDSL hydrolase family protein [Nonomuraea spiralis]|uniref:SGNH/GDSL hydrolase family protein n=1 Tax=Nonomuraea spiralis TaxID=46182 RepID=A0ABV5IQ01_9ACTN|nr:SGNH/GDSL hydrolase family protein [Nonomuraea spiralis]GGT11355.1 hypothetical protein GCM10010176_064990 [Nonomuraea spiralis]
MHNNSLPTRRRTIKRAALALTAVSLSAALAACGEGSGGGNDAKTTAATSGKSESTGKKVLWLGDSIAGAEAPALGAALKASGVEFKNATSSGGGNVVAGEHPVTKMGAKDTWQQLGKNLAEFKPDVVAYQITTYDWGTRQQQLAAYRKLAATVQKAGGELVIVSAPPFKLDDFYKQYASAIRSAPETARQAVQDGKAQFLDASELWGADASASKAQRSKDGIHSCQQGSAAFAKWFTGKLGEQLGFTPAAPEVWANGSWVGDERFSKLGCA